MADAKMDVIIQLKDEMSKQLKNLTGALDDTRKKISTIAKDVRGVSTEMVAIGGAMTFAFKKTIDASNELNNSLIGLSSVAAAFGVDAGKATEAARRLSEDGLMSVKSSATGLKNLIATGFSLPEAIKLMEAFKDSASFNRQASLGFGQAIEGATEGIKNQNSILVDNAGITKNLSNILKEAGFSAQQLGEVTTDVAVRTALYNGILKEANAFQGDAIKASQTLSGQQAELATQIFMLKAAIGEVLAPALTELIGKISGYLAIAMEWIEQNPELTQQIVIFTASVGGLILALGTLGITISTVGIAITAFNPYLLLIMGAIALISVVLKKLGIDFSEQFNIITNVIVAFAKVAIKIFDVVTTGIKYFIVGLGGAIKMAIQGVMVAVESMVNYVIDKINALIKKVQTVLSLINKITGSNFSLSTLDRVDFSAPKTMLEGLPANSSNMSVVPQMSTPAQNISVNVSGTFLSDDAGEQVANMVVKQLQLYTPIQ